MRKASQGICLIIAILILFSFPATAQENMTRASSYIVGYDSYIYRPSGTEIQVWFEILGTKTMNEIGVGEIRVQRSSTGTGNWTTMKTYLPEDYPQMLSENNYTHTGYVSYSATRGYYYRAVVTFYASDEGGTGTCFDYAETIYIPLSGNGGRSQ